MLTIMLSNPTEATRNPIASQPPPSLTEYFEKFCLPVNLRECIDQHRVDRYDAAMSIHNLKTDDLWLTSVRDEIPFDSFSEVFDPFGYYELTGPIYQPPSLFAELPPVPSDVLKEGCPYYEYVGDQILDLQKHLTRVSTQKVLALAAVVAAYYLDDLPSFGHDRMEAIRYIAVNTRSKVRLPAQTLILKEGEWKKRMRRYGLPDMVTIRKADFSDLFGKLEQPIRHEEFQCMSTHDIIEYAVDQRSLLLSQNRHVVFCSTCSDRLLSVLGQIESQKRNPYVM